MPGLLGAFGDLEVPEFRDPQAGSIDGRQNRAGFKTPGGLEQGRDFRLTQHGWEGLGALGLGDILDHPGLAQRDAVEKAQGTDGLDDARPRGVLLLDEIELILADMLGIEVVRWGPKIMGKVGDKAGKAGDGLWGIVPELEIVVHPLA